MKKAFVTGATGMIGLALIDECLRQGVRVYALVREDSPRAGRLPDHDGLVRVNGSLDDLDNLPALVGDTCDVFFHLAWGNTGAARNASTERQAANISWTLKAVRAAAALGCSRFVGAGSQAEYGPKDLPVIRPDTPAAPNTPYGAAKLSACLLSHMLADEIGIEWIWPRIFSIYGPYDKPSTMIASSVSKMLAGEGVHFSPATHRWEYLYSRDAGKAMYLLGEKGVPGKIYCLGSGQSRPLIEFIEEMAEACGAELSGVGDIPYPKNRPVRNLCADISSLCEDTGFQVETDFSEGIRETAEFIRRHGKA